jgi:hypothetical protein
VAPGVSDAASNCTNSLATNYNANCTLPACTDDGSCVYPDDPHRCPDNAQRNVAVRVKVTNADLEMKWAIDGQFMSPHSYGPFSNFGSGGAEMVLCMDGGSGSDGMDHRFQYRGGGEGSVQIEGLEAAACPQAGMESCVLMGDQRFDPQDGDIGVNFHVGLAPAPPPIDPQAECSMKYVNAYMTFMPGNTCDGSAPCTTACQELITDVLRSCRNNTYAGGSPPTCINNKGSGVVCELSSDEKSCKTTSQDCTYTEHGPAQTFDENAVEGFQKMGPADCDYSLGYEVRMHCLPSTNPFFSYHSLAGIKCTPGAFAARSRAKTVSAHCRTSTTSTAHSLGCLSAWRCASGTQSGRIAPWNASSSSTQSPPSAATATTLRSSSSLQPRLLDSGSVHLVARALQNRCGQHAAQVGMVATASANRRIATKSAKRR